MSHLGINSPTARLTNCDEACTDDMKPWYSERQTETLKKKKTFIVYGKCFVSDIM